jgi:predicted O-methyltransferase YrrM
MPHAMQVRVRSSVHERHIRAISKALNELANVRTLWSRGCVNKGGPHRRLAGSPTPVSIGEDECEVFGAVIERFKPKHCYIVGNAFGFSAAYIALAMRDIGAEHVVALDAELEGDGVDLANVARGLAKNLQVDLLHIKKGFSPQDVPATVEVDKYDLIFIDGNHNAPYVRNDLHGLLPYMHDETVVVFHDFFLDGVRDGVEAALASGLHCLWLPTSCEMVVATRSETRLQQLREIFPKGAGVPSHRRKVSLHPEKGSYWFWLTRVLPVHWAVWLERTTGKRPLRPSASR